jgi:hypothetical protein
MVQLKVGGLTVVGALATVLVGLSSCAGGNSAGNAGQATAGSTQAAPDWSGVWSLKGGYVFDVSTAKDPGDKIFGVSPLASEVIPYNDEYQKKYAAILKGRAELIYDDPVANCQPFGFPRIVGATPNAFEVIVTPKVVFMIWQIFQQIRRIYIGAEHIPEDESYPTYFGDSIGHWEGDTLVIDTIGAKEGTYDRTGAPHSDQVHAVERWHKIGDKTLEVQITIEDPVMLTRPWVVTRQYGKTGDAGARVGEFFCDLNRTPIVIGPDGKPRQGAILPGDPPVK